MGFRPLNCQLFHVSERYNFVFSLKVLKTEPFQLNMFTYKLGEVGKNNYQIVPVFMYLFFFFLIANKPNISEKLD